MDTPKRQGRRALVTQAVDTALLPLRTLVSKRAQKAYLGTALFTATSFFLLSTASIIFWIFYYEYVPQPGVERIVYLQFGGDNPHGRTLFPGALIPKQSYDIYLLLNLPRTPNNVQVGNFMLSLSLLPTTAGSVIPTAILPSALTANNETIAHSRRPTILTYSSSFTSTASTLVSLPFYVLGFSKESEALTVPMFEGIEFAKGAGNLPQAANIVVEADDKMQFYEVRIRIIAKLSGLRWVLYHHRIASFFVFTTIFWGSSMISMGIVWLFLSMYFDSSPPETKPKTEDDSIGSIIKTEPTPDSEVFDPHSFEDLSDTSRTYPTLGRQKPLRYSTGEGHAIKKQEDDGVGDETIVPLQATAAEADDEDESEDAEATSSAWRDSGIGTSLDEERRAGVQRRRKGLLGSAVSR